jgi:Ca2+-binding RTX toxin-like protein
MSKESEFTETTGPEPQNAPKAAGSARKRATLKINTLEPRILLSATMVEAESTEVAEEAAHEEFYADSDASLVVKGTDGVDWLNGSDKNDLFIGGRGNDNLSGGDGDDQFVYREGDGADRYTGGSGKDVINATEAKTLELQRFQAVNSIESIFGGSEGLSIVGSKGNDVLDFSMTTLEHVTGIDAGDGNDTVIGSAGDDVIIGGRGNDNLSGGDGDDQFVYREGDGADRYTGGSGKDVINATEAKTLELQRFQAVNSIESIFGGSEGLSIVGSKGNDVLDFSMTTLEHVTGIDAGDGNDTVIGSAGDDVIIGGRGNDNLSGGDGDDQFVYREGDGADRSLHRRISGGDPVKM